MVKIELRGDDWYEAGKESENKFAHMAYETKQELKKKLSELNEKSLDRSELIVALGDITIAHNPSFRGHPYIKGNNILIDTRGPPGEAYLGQIIA